MKISILLTLVIILVFFNSCSDKPTIEKLKEFAATETFPEDIYLDTVANKRALIIVAHDDDDCAMSGTIAKLTAQGWTIKQLCLETHSNPKTGKNPSHLICQGSELILKDGIYRTGMDSNTYAYLPIPLEEIKKQFLHQKVEASLVHKINEFRPSVIFTLDNIKGGYGHPDHIFISQLVLDLFKENRIITQRIYQSVYTNHMEEEIVDKWLASRMKAWGYPHASTIANELYGIKGMPEPNVQIDIIETAESKMLYLRTYPENVRKNLRKFIPYYEEFDAQTYFSIFDREFFRIIHK